MLHMGLCGCACTCIHVCPSVSLFSVYFCLFIGGKRPHNLFRKCTMFLEYMQDFSSVNFCGWNKLVFSLIFLTVGEMEFTPNYGKRGHSCMLKFIGIPVCLCKPVCFLLSVNCCVANCLQNPMKPQHIGICRRWEKCNYAIEVVFCCVEPSICCV